ncbi:hypothetical protein V8E53_003819 [Lactarius tabidus]
MAPIAQLTPNSSIFHNYFLERYPALKAQHPSLGRRALLLLIADEFWSLDARTWTALASATDSPPGPPPWTHDADEYDIKDDATVPPGIIVRTDYNTGSDDAWAAFCSALHDAERDFFADADQAPNPPPSSGDDVAIPPTTTSNDSDDSDDASTDDESSLALFAPLSDLTRFNNISNLRALRLFFDVSARATQQSAAQQHRLSGLRGLQETYDARGRTLWIFDARSRDDGCARLVSEAGDVATGDSWRARATHMAELQAGLAARALRIDFGGLDRWDYDERRRNMLEADAGHAAVLSGSS